MDEQVQGDNPSLDLGKLTKAYIKLRDARANLKKTYEAEDTNLAEQMSVIESEFLNRCATMNANSIRTPHGTIIRSVKSRYWTNDWDSMYQVIKERDAFGLLEKRLNQTNVKQFLEENPDVLPHGLNVENAYSVLVRRAKEK
jgi:hypothetical protein